MNVWTCFKYLLQWLNSCKRKIPVHRPIVTSCIQISHKEKYCTGEVRICAASWKRSLTMRQASKFSSHIFALRGNVSRFSAQLLKTMDVENTKEDEVDTNTKRKQFGNRYLTDPQNVFEHNAWFVLHRSRAGAGNAEYVCISEYFFWLFILFLRIRFEYWWCCIGNIVACLSFVKNRSLRETKQTPVR